MTTFVRNCRISSAVEQRFCKPLHAGGNVGNLCNDYSGMTAQTASENAQNTPSTAQSTATGVVTVETVAHSTCCYALALAFFATLNSDPEAMRQAMQAARECEEEL